MVQHDALVDEMETRQDELGSLTTVLDQLIEKRREAEKKRAALMEEERLRRFEGTEL